MLRTCMSGNILLDEYTVECLLCLHQQHRHLRTQREDREEIWNLLHISGDDRAYEGIFFVYGLLIRCLKLGLNALPQDDFTDLLQAVYIQQY